ncbi:DUF655 domain-containing protein [Candidatus Micrarchaeota archaeon]|nr:DUF655 domain-containing protein [Candidatus Micrarchaeota archaeon]
MFKREENAFVLDFLPQGKSGEAKREPVVQLLGDAQFTLLEATPKPGEALALGEEVYIGRGDRNKVTHIRGRIQYNQLTNAAQRELEVQVGQIVLRREAEFVHFLNRAGSISIRVHALELLPSIGKKHLQALLSEREKKPFENFADVNARVHNLGRVDEIFTQRILSELRGDEKYYLFVKMPSRDDEPRRRRF